VDDRLRAVRAVHWKDWCCRLRDYRFESRSDMFLTWWRVTRFDSIGFLLWLWFPPTLDYKSPNIVSPIIYKLPLRSWFNILMTWGTQPHSLREEQVRDMTEETKFWRRKQSNLTVMGPLTLCIIFISNLFYCRMLFFLIFRVASVFSYWRGLNKSITTWCQSAKMLRVGCYKQNTVLMNWMSGCQN
jgi:hypothetical protein